MQVGVEDLAFAQLHPFGRLRFLDLHDHVGILEDFASRGSDLRAGGDIVGIRGTDAGAGIGLDQHGMAVRDIFADRSRRQADAIFVVLDFLRATDAH
jgi:hypothetical protein